MLNTVLLRDPCLWLKMHHHLSALPQLFPPVHITTACPDLILTIITVPCQCQYFTSDQMILITHMKFVTTYSVIIVSGKLLGTSQLLWEITTRDIVMTVLIKMWMSTIVQVRISMNNLLHQKSYYIALVCTVYIGYFEVSKDKAPKGKHLIKREKSNGKSVIKCYIPCIYCITPFCWPKCYSFK